LGKLVTISVKVPVELKEKLERYRIRVSEVVRRALELEVRKAELKELESEISKIAPILRKVPPENILEDIRSSRRER